MDGAGRRAVGTEQEVEVRGVDRERPIPCSLKCPRPFQFIPMSMALDIFNRIMLVAFGVIDLKFGRSTKGHLSSAIK